MHAGSQDVPRYLAGYESLYAESPREAALAWFREARFGLFLHYGLYSLLGRGEWVQFTERIPLADYETLRERFTAERFDAEAIAGLAVRAGMRYVTLTTRHHDSFCLFRSEVSDYTTAASACGRDLVAEMASACERHGLGLFLYYSYALDWRHPWFYPSAFLSMARPAYDPPEPRYLWRYDRHFERYIAFVHAQLRELLTGYGAIAGVWFDPIMGYYARPDLFPADETYALIRELQPQALIGFKQGATGDEDFAAPERAGCDLGGRVHSLIGANAARVAAEAWRRNQGKPMEICDTLQPHAWGYNAADDGAHRDARDVRAMIEHAAGNGANLLLNAGPLPDGRLHPEDVSTLETLAPAGTC